MHFSRNVVLGRLVFFQFFSFFDRGKGENDSEKSRLADELSWNPRTVSFRFQELRISQRSMKFHSYTDIVLVNVIRREKITISAQAEKIFIFFRVESFVRLRGCCESAHSDSALGSCLISVWCFFWVFFYALPRSGNCLTIPAADSHVRPLHPSTFSKGRVDVSG